MEVGVEFVLKFSWGSPSAVWTKSHSLGKIKYQRFENQTPSFLKEVGELPGERSEVSTWTLFIHPSNKNPIKRQHQTPFARCQDLTQGASCKRWEGPEPFVPTGRCSHRCRCYRGGVSEPLPLPPLSTQVKYCSIIAKSILLSFLQNNKNNVNQVNSII